MSGLLSAKWLTLKNPVTLRFLSWKLERQYQTYLLNSTMWANAASIFQITSLTIVVSIFLVIWGNQTTMTLVEGSILVATASFGSYAAAVFSLCPNWLRNIYSCLGIQNKARLLRFLPSITTLYKMVAYALILVVSVVALFVDSEEDYIEFVLTMYFIAFTGLPVCTPGGLGVCYVVTILSAIIRTIFFGLDESYCYQTYMLCLFAAYGVVLFFIGRGISRAYRESYVSAFTSRLERQRATAVLYHMLPRPIAQELMLKFDRLDIGKTAPNIADTYSNVTVVFVEIIGYHEYVSSLPPLQLMHLLSNLFSSWASIVEHHGLFAVQNIGGSFMFAAGCPASDAHTVRHPQLSALDEATAYASAAAYAALDILAVTRAFEPPPSIRDRHRDSTRPANHCGTQDGSSPSSSSTMGWVPPRIRIGMNTGPLQAGVTGTTKFAFHLFGDTVNTSARMETNCPPGMIQMTKDTARLLRRTRWFSIESRGVLPIKGKGDLPVYTLHGLSARCPSKQRKFSVLMDDCSLPPHLLGPKFAGGGRGGGGGGGGGHSPHAVDDWEDEPKISALFGRTRADQRYHAHFRQANRTALRDIERSVLSCQIRWDFMDHHYREQWYWVVFVIAAIAMLDYLSSWVYHLLDCPEDQYEPDGLGWDVAQVFVASVIFPVILVLVAASSCAPQRWKLWRVLSYLEAPSLFVLNMASTVRMIAVQRFRSGVLSKLIGLMAYQACGTTHFTLAAGLGALDALVLVGWGMGAAGAGLVDPAVPQAGLPYLYIMAGAVAWVGSIASGYSLQLVRRRHMVMTNAAARELRRAETLLAVCLPKHVRKLVEAQFAHDERIPLSTRGLRAMLNVARRLWRKVMGDADNHVKVYDEDGGDGLGMMKQGDVEEDDIYDGDDDDVDDDDGGGGVNISCGKNCNLQMVCKPEWGVVYGRHEGVTILFSDIVGFTSLSSTLSANDLFNILNALYTGFDQVADRLGVFKIEVIGDAYVCAGGLDPRARNAEPYAVRMCKMAHGMLEVVERVRKQSGKDIGMRIGLHTGPVIGGVIGRHNIRYHVWGTTLLIAEQMESGGVAGRVHVTNTTKSLLETSGYHFERRHPEDDGRGDDGQQTPSWLITRGGA